MPLIQQAPHTRKATFSLLFAISVPLFPVLSGILTLLLLFLLTSVLSKQRCLVHTRSLCSSLSHLLAFSISASVPLTAVLFPLHFQLTSHGEVYAYTRGKGRDGEYECSIEEDRMCSVEGRRIVSLGRWPSERMRVRQRSLNHSFYMSHSLVASLEMRIPADDQVYEKDVVAKVERRTKLDERKSGG